MNSYTNNQALEKRRTFDELELCLQECLRKVAEAKRKLNASSTNPDSYPAKPATPEPVIVAVANGRPLTEKEARSLNEKDFDIVLNIPARTLKFRKNPVNRSSALKEANLAGIGPRRIMFFTYMLENPSRLLSVEKASRLLYRSLKDENIDIDSNTLAKTISLLRNALEQNPDGPYILTVDDWDGYHKSYQLNPGLRYLLIKKNFKITPTSLPRHTGVIKRIYHKGKLMEKMK